MVSIQEMKEKIASLNVNNPNHDGIKLAEFFGEMGLQKQMIADFLLKEELYRVEKEKEYQGKINFTIKTMVSKRHNAMKSISEYITSETQKAQNELKNKVKIVLVSLDRVNVERAKLGL